MTAFIGTAGWSIPKGVAGSFDREGPALARYASRFRAVEINSSFYRSHRPETYAKWAGLVPAEFRFAVKVPRAVTHEARLVGCRDLLAAFCNDVSMLGDKLRVLLVQLPPNLPFDSLLAGRFFDELESRTPARIVCEPRHPSWFDQTADTLLAKCRIARVAADPAPVPSGANPGGWPGLEYFRLHGSPTIYRSAYGAPRVADYAQRLEQSADAGQDAWCIFDNTASSAAISDALLMTGGQ